MSLVNEYHREHVARRLRMAVAARGVVDDGIDLKRKSRATTVSVAPEPLPPPPPESEPIVEAALPVPVPPAPEPPPIITPVAVDTIKYAVCGFYSISLEEMIGPRRLLTLILPRHIAIYLVGEMTNFSTTMIGRFFGGRDHATVLHAQRRVKALVESDPKIREDIRGLVHRIVEITEAAA